VKFWGVYKLLVGMLATGESLFGMIQTVNGGRETLWGPAALAASILLTIEGLGQLFPKLHGYLLITLAAVIPISFPGVFPGWQAPVWIFAVVLAFLEWMFQSIANATAQQDIGALAFSVVLMAALANTTFELFWFYWNEPSFWPLGQIFKFMSPIALPWTLVVILLVQAVRGVVAAGVEESVASAETQNN
jgi:hypothetical protein